MELPLIALLFAALCSVARCTDLTIVPGATGPEVVESVVNLIRESCLFAEDKRFLRRLAYVESHDGTTPGTYRSGYYGGIWQVDKDEFDKTKDQPSLSMHYTIIAREFGINWSNVRWVDLQKPLYSGIAAALYTLIKSAPNGVSWKTEEQGQFWAANFHHGSSASNFSTLAKILDQGCQLHQRADIVFIVDSSTSLTPDDFNRAKDFMKTFVDGFQVTPELAQIALIVYSSKAHTEFYLNSHSSVSSVKNAIDQANYQPGSTATDKAVDMAVNQVFNPANGARNGVVKVMIVVTDGDSDDRINTIHAAQRAHGDSIVAFSLGIGDQIQTSELKTLASNPRCTHTYKAKSYEEIRFVKEEIQKATCIAPLYINNTFSCKMEHCPPLAVLTGKTGVTIKTSISCGGINVFTSATNPYPNSANNEHQQTTLEGHTSSTFYGVTDKTLYINIKDNQLSQFGNYNGSEGCVATITPCFGNCDEKSVKCFRGAVEVTCDSSFFNCTEKWNFQNPCRSDSTNQRFPHPYFNNRFLMCDLKQKVYVVLCPPGEIYVQDCHQCIGESSTTITAGCGNTGIEPTQNLTNPCTRENILADKMFFPYPGDATKYIHCDIWGKPWQRQCQGGMEWDQSLETCIRITTYDPCVHHVVGTPYLYPHQCDPQKYIHCDTNHQSFVQHCQFDYVFYNESRTCVPIGSYPGTETPVNRCHGEFHPYYTVNHQQNTQPAGPVVTPQYVTEIGTTNHYGYLFSRTKYAEPCTRANIAAGKLYFPYAYNNHNYIQCDLYGDAYLQDCAGSGRNFYDPYAFVCVDGPVFVDSILTRPPRV